MDVGWEHGEQRRDQPPTREPGAGRDRGGAAQHLGGAARVDELVVGGQVVGHDRHVPPGPGEMHQAGEHVERTDCAARQRARHGRSIPGYAAGAGAVRPASRLARTNDPAERGYVAARSLRSIGPPMSASRGCPSSRSIHTTSTSTGSDLRGLTRGRARRWSSCTASRHGRSCGAR